MTRMLFVGDTHGDMGFLEGVFGYAVDNHCQAVFQVGDFGFLWPKADLLMEVQALATHATLPLYWIDGNHDWHTEIRKRFPPTDFIDNNPGVYHVRRGSTVDFHGLRICGLGGAPSIDRAHRRAGSSWWPEEVISSEDVDTVPDLYHFDVLATHDAPKMPPGFGKTGSAAFDDLVTLSHQRICQTIEKTKPSLIIHGHWHKRYTQKFGESTLIGLDCNNARWLDAMVIVDKDEDRLTWMSVT